MVSPPADPTPPLSAAWDEYLAVRSGAGAVGPTAAWVAAWLDRHPAHRGGLVEKLLDRVVLDWRKARPKPPPEAAVAHLPAGDRPRAVAALRAAGSDGTAPASHKSLERLDEFELRRVLGEGGVSVVYLAFDTRLGRPVAVKRVRHDRSRDPRYAASLRNEARLAGAVRPGVLAVYDLRHRADGEIYVVREYFNGRTLTDYLARPPRPRPSRDDLVELFRQICLAVAGQHSAEPPVLHGDLKPDNVLVDTAGFVKVIDFGHGDRAGGPGVAPAGGPPVAGGTPAYMSPQRAGGGPPTAADDVFALGLILCEMLTGRPAYAGADVWSQARQAALTPALAAVAEAAVEAELADVARRCLATDPAGRWLHAREVAVDTRRRSASG